MNYNEIQYFNNLPKILQKEQLNIKEDDVSYSRIETQSLETLEIDDVKGFVRQHGFCLIKLQKELKPIDWANFLTPHLGSLISQTPKGDDFIYEVDYNPTENGKKRRMQLNSNKAQPMHTDGHFKAKSPTTIALFCQKQAEQGGYSKMVSSENIYNYLQKICPKVVPKLFNLEAIKYTRKRPGGGLYEYTKPLFTQKEDGSIAMAYNPIMYKITAEKDVEQALQLINYFTNNPNNQITYKLAENELLLLDNQKMLHGRSEFNQTLRKLARLWFSGE